MQRTKDEKNGFKSAIAKLKMSPEWPLYVAEVTRLREAAMASMYKEKGEDLAKVAGLLRGIDLCLHIEDFA